MSATTELPIIIDRRKILYFVTIFDFPHCTVRHQVAAGDTMVEQVTTFSEWLVLESKRMGKRTGMTFGVVPNSQGQIALAVLRV